VAEPHARPRSGVPWWAPLLALAALAAGVAAAAVATTRDGAAQQAATHGVLGTRAAITTQSQTRAQTRERRPATTHRSDRSLVSAGRPLLPVDVHELRSLAGRYAVANGVRVLDVVGPRIFWIGNGGSRVLVHLQGRGTRYAIRPGQRLDFTAVVTRNAPRAAPAWGLTFREGRGRLRAQGMHLEVYGPRIRFR
jgi:hypothetical protein